MKSAFSLLEIIIGILIIGLISSFAIPKLMDTKDYANATTLQRDISAIVSSAQTYKLQNESFEKIEEAIALNKNIWEIEDDTTIKDKTGCVEIELDLPNTITVSLTDSDDNVCEKLKSSYISKNENEIKYEL